jgi:hypothetical protein
MHVNFKVAAQCKSASGEIIEPGEYSGTRNERPDVNDAKSLGAPFYILTRPRPVLPINVSTLVKTGEILVS